MVWSPSLLRYRLYHVKVNSKLIINQNYFPGWWVKQGDCWENAISSSGLLSTKIKKAESEITFIYNPYLLITNRDKKCVRAT
jgi:hypothetical protein